MLQETYHNPAVSWGGYGDHDYSAPLDGIECEEEVVTESTNFYSPTPPAPAPAPPAPTNKRKYTQSVPFQFILNVLNVYLYINIPY